MEEMRQTLSHCIIDAMKDCEKVVLIDADLGRANGTHPVSEAYPDRCIQVGVAEQNMASFAAGMASYGFIPIINTFAAFASRRICDQVAISICFANQNVKIIGTDPGIAAELNGGTHMAIEDIGVLRSIPNILIFEPVDSVELKKGFIQFVNYAGPAYLRMYRKVAAPVYDESYRFDLFKASVVKEGSDITIVASGIMVSEALSAYEMLQKEGIHAEVINVHTIKPIDAETITVSAKKTGAIVTCENHNVLGGLRAAVAEVITMNYPVPVIPIGIQNVNGEVGKLPFLKERFGLTGSDICRAAREAMSLRTCKA